MYKIEYLSIAKEDLLDIVNYIKMNLYDKEVALNIVIKITNAIQNLETFPYAYPLYISIKPLANEYRKLIVDSYLIFYHVDEKEKNVTISRIVHFRQDYLKKIKKN